MPELKKQINIHISESEYEKINQALVEEIKRTGKPQTMAAFMTAKVLELFKIGGK